MHINYVPDRAADGFVRGFSFALSDLTEIRRSEDSSSREQRMALLMENVRTMRFSPLTPAA